MVAMKQLISPVGEARDDFAIFAELARKLGVERDFTEGRTVMQWLNYLYDESRGARSRSRNNAAEFRGVLECRSRRVFLARRPAGVPERFSGAIPGSIRLDTPSGLIELYSEEVAGFGYEECPGYPFWKPV